MKNNRTFLEKLLDGAEVEWKTLDEIFHLRNGYTPSKGVKEYWENGSIPWFRMEDIRENGRVLNTALQKVSESAVKGGKLFPANSIIIATSATIGEHALITIPFLANQRFTVLSLKPEYIDKFNIYFLYHYCFTLDDWCQKNTTMSSFASVDMNGFRKFLIPIPPLSVQTEIVKILDALTALTSELTSELILRQKQYEYYREKLLSEEELEKVGFEWKYLTQVADLTRGRVISKEYLSDNVGDYPVYSSQTVDNGEIGKIDSFDFDGEFVSWTTDGANAGTVFYRSGKFSITNVCGLIKIKNNPELNYKFLFYWLSIEAKKHVYSGMGNPKLMSHQMEKIKIPIPPLSIQTKIVKILDKFESLTHSITEGLPLAIEQSQKRYEYYRELLLNFHNP
ncbi:restriction endonuclease subunit S [Haemophilus parainfluenzae]|jgi:type-1 restriction enzyme ecoprrI specificity protein|uniref:restriction endonuclease subunit S n=1 Tax=Haemophilus parainfluenzae TaxID=729 RepID=UPI00066E2A82|nr:restriction endonuclease subunit S [Haemophilus parainfluenzae]